MSYTITYERTSFTENPCSASTRFGNEPVCGMGKTFADARKRLIEKLQLLTDRDSEPIPPNEEVDIY